MSVSRTDHLSSVGKQQVKKGLKKVVKKKHATKKKASIGRVAKKQVEYRAIITSKPEGRLSAGPESVSIEEVEEIVSNYREHTRSKLAKEFPKIVDNMLKAAKTGRLTDTKMKILLDLAGVKEDSKEQASQKRGPSLGELLLDEVKRRRQAAMMASSESSAEETGARLITVSRAMEGMTM